MVSLFFGWFTKLYTVFMDTFLGFLPNDAPTLTGFLLTPVKILNSLALLMPQTITAIKMMLGVSIGLFLAWIPISVAIKLGQIIFPNPFIKSDVR